MAHYKMNHPSLKFTTMAAVETASSQETMLWHLHSTPDQQLPVPLACHAGRHGRSRSLMVLSCVTLFLATTSATWSWSTQRWLWRTGMLLVEQSLNNSTAVINNTISILIVSQNAVDAAAAANTDPYLRSTRSMTNSGSGSLGTTIVTLKHLPPLPLGTTAQVQQEKEVKDLHHVGGVLSSRSGDSLNDKTTSVSRNPSNNQTRHHRASSSWRSRVPIKRSRSRSNSTINNTSSIIVTTTPIQSSILNQSASHDPFGESPASRSESLLSLLLPPMALLQTYRLEHNADVLREELDSMSHDVNDSRFQERRFVLAKFECPFQAGMKSLPFLNSFLLAVALNRTILMHYSGANGNDEAACRQVLDFADWIPQAAEFAAQIVSLDSHVDYSKAGQEHSTGAYDDDSVDGDANEVNDNKRDNSNSTVESDTFGNATRTWTMKDAVRALCNSPKPLQFSGSIQCRTLLKAVRSVGEKSLIFGDGDKSSNNSSNSVGGSRIPTEFQHLPNGPIFSRRKVWRSQRVFSPTNPLKHWIDFRDVCFSLMNSRRLLWDDADDDTSSPRSIRRRTVQQRQEEFVPLHLQPRIQQMYQQGVGFLYGMLYYSVFTVTDRVRRHIAPQDWVVAPEADYFSIGMHSRHPSYIYTGDDVRNETSCLDALMARYNTAEDGTLRKPCKVYLMSDRPVTVQGVAAYAAERYQCEAIVTHNLLPVNSTRANSEHGPAAGMGYYQEVLVVGGQARSAYMSQFRSSSLLPYATMEYQRRLDALQRAHKSQQHVTGSPSLTETLSLHTLPNIPVCKIKGTPQVFTLR